MRWILGFINLWGDTFNYYDNGKGNPFGAMIMISSLLVLVGITLAVLVMWDIPPAFVVRIFILCIVGTVIPMLIYLKRMKND